MSHKEIFRNACGRGKWCGSLDVLERGDHSLLGRHLVGNVMVMMMMVVVVVVRVSLLAFGSAQGGTSTGAVFVVLGLIILRLSALVTGSTVTASLGVGGYVLRCMLQILAPP